MAEAIDNRAAQLEKAVRDRFAAWSQDREMFASMFPGVTIELPAGRVTPADELRAIASAVIQGSGFNWTVAELVDGSGVFFIGQYVGPGSAI